MSYSDSNGITDIPVVGVQAMTLCIYHTRFNATSAGKLLYYPNMNKPEHCIIEISVDSARIMREWLDDYIDCFG